MTGGAAKCCSLAASVASQHLMAQEQAEALSPTPQSTELVLRGTHHLR